jgi:hypothetical protein
MSDAKLSFNFGEVSFSAEGSAAWVKEQFERALKRLDETHVPAKTEGQGELKTKTPQGSGHQAHSNLAINSIAAKLEAKTGTDLVLAACFSLTRNQTESCSRVEILAEMKRATSYYKTTYNNNLSSYFTTLIKDKKILERSTDSYALSASARKDLEAKVA